MCLVLFIIVAGTDLLGGAVQLSRQADGFYRFQAYVVLAVLALLLAWPTDGVANGLSTGHYDLRNQAYRGSVLGIEQLSGPGWLRLCP